MSLDPKSPEAVAVVDVAVVVAEAAAKVVAVVGGADAHKVAAHRAVAVVAGPDDHPAVAVAEVAAAVVADAREIANATLGPRPIEAFLPSERSERVDDPFAGGECLPESGAWLFSSHEDFYHRDDTFIECHLFFWEKSPD